MSKANAAILASAPASDAAAGSAGALARALVIGLTAFLTVVDLFAVQAILPSLRVHFGVTPAQMGAAANASTLGMAIGGLTVAFFSRHINRRWGVLVSLALLAVPTAMLALAPDLTTFSVLRVVQGLFMSAAFTLTLAYLGEQCSAKDAAGAFAAYITGNVASNLVGRMIAAALVDHVGLAANFYVFALLNFAGAVLVYFTLTGAQPMTAGQASGRSPLSIWVEHFRNPALRRAFGIGFCILFAFIGTFTYVNFVLVREPFMLGPMTLGLVYLVFLPSILTTPLAGRAVDRFGTRKTFWGAMAVAAAGLPLLLAPQFLAVVIGMVLVAVGTFFAQATATGFVSRAATIDRGSASGIYLAAYFIGGMVGSIVLGQLYMRFGWAGCVAGIGAALGLASVLAIGLRKVRPAAVMMRAA
jgi:MFS transporter, YNFM family, putative membrane transport protein